MRIEFLNSHFIGLIWILLSRRNDVPPLFLSKRNWITNLRQRQAKIKTDSLTGRGTRAECQTAFIPSLPDLALILYAEWKRVLFIRMLRILQQWKSNFEVGKPKEWKDWSAAKSALFFEVYSIHTQLKLENILTVYMLQCGTNHRTIAKNSHDLAWNFGKFTQITSHSLFYGGKYTMVHSTVQTTHQHCTHNANLTSLSCNCAKMLHVAPLRCVLVSVLAQVG